MENSAATLQNEKIPYKPRILDIGIGKGGVYLKDSEDFEYYALDPESEDLKIVGQEHPSIKTFQGYAENMPFPANFFDQIRIYFPYKTLLLGLRGESVESATVIPELYRVLDKEGKLTIIGDNLAGIKKIAKSIEDYFTPTGEITNLTPDELEKLGTKHALFIRKEMEFNKTSQGFQVAVQKLEFQKNHQSF